MVHVGVSKFHVESVEDWSKITVFIDVKRTTEINVEIFKINGNSITIWDPPSIGGLFSMHVKLFKCWEIHDNFWLIVGICHSKFNVLNIKLWFIVMDITPVDVPSNVVP